MASNGKAIYRESLSNNQQCTQKFLMATSDTKRDKLIKCWKVQLIFGREMKGRCIGRMWERMSEEWKESTVDRKYSDGIQATELTCNAIIKTKL